MNTYRITLTLRGSLGTPLSADTLWGHVCWGLRYHEGPDALEDFLARTASSGDTGPPLVLSDPLPAGCLPRPCLPPLAPEDDQQLEDELVRHNLLPARLVERHGALGAARKCPFLPLESFAGMIDGLTLTAWAKAACRRRPQEPEPAGRRMITATVAHNTIDRLTNHTLAEGGLFFQEETFIAEPVAYDLWARSPLPAERVLQLIQWGLEGGYGRDASTGKGHLEVGPIEQKDLPAARQPNALMTLGPCAPAAEDPPVGHWSTVTRFGKLGGLWATAAEDGPDPGVFKHPVVFLATGAILKSPPRPFVGRLVRNVHPTREQVVQYGLALTVPVRCPHLEEVR